MSYDDAIAELEERIKQQAAVIEQMRQALQLCRSHMYCHASNTGDNAFDKLCSALANEIPTEVGSGADEIIRLREELAAAQDDVVAWKYEADGFRRGRDALSAELIAAQKDTERYRWLREYLPSYDESWDDALVAAGTAEEIDAVIDDAVLRAAATMLAITRAAAAIGRQVKENKNAE